jgi:hypothetical protein
MNPFAFACPRKERARGKVYDEYPKDGTARDLYGRPLRNGLQKQQRQNDFSAKPDRTNIFGGKK